MSSGSQPTLPSRLWSGISFSLPGTPASASHMCFRTNAGLCLASHSYSKGHESCLKVTWFSLLTYPSLILATQTQLLSNWKQSRSGSYICFVSEPLSPLWGLCQSWFLNRFADFSSDSLLSVRDVALTSSSRTCALFPPLTRRAMQLSEKPLIPSVLHQIKTSLPITFQISVALP